MATREVHYALIARKNKPLADYSEKKANFDQFTMNVLKQLKTSPGQYMLDYEDCEYMYEITAKDRGLVFLILVEKGFKKETGFAMLGKMRQVFIDMFTQQRISKTKSYGLSKEFKEEFRTLIENYSSESFDKAGEAIRQMGLLKEKTTDNLARLLDRDEKFDDLLQKADTLGEVTVQMQKKTIKVKRKAIWSGIGFKVAMIFMSLIFIYLILGIVCGFNLSGCRKNN